MQKGVRHSDQSDLMFFRLHFYEFHSFAQQLIEQVNNVVISLESCTSTLERHHLKYFKPISVMEPYKPLRRKTGGLKGEVWSMMDVHTHTHTKT